MEESIMKRIDEITSEYAELPQLDDFDLTIEAIGDNGDVKVTLKRANATIERTIGIKEPLDFIGETFNYSDTITPQSKDISPKGLKGAYFGKWNDLLVEREGVDGVCEIFRVKDSQRDKVTAILKEKLGHKFAKPVKKAPVVKSKPKVTEEMHKIYFTIDGKTDYFIIAGDSAEQVKTTALDVIQKRGLDFKENNVYSQKINN